MIVPLVDWRGSDKYGSRRTRTCRLCLQKAPNSPRALTRCSYSCNLNLLMKFDSPFPRGEGHMQTRETRYSQYTHKIYSSATCKAKLISALILVAPEVWILGCRAGFESHMRMGTLRCFVSPLFVLTSRLSEIIRARCREV